MKNFSPRGRFKIRVEITRYFRTNISMIILFVDNTGKHVLDSSSNKFRRIVDLTNSNGKKKRREEKKKERRKKKEEWN